MFFSKISILEYLKKRRKIISVSILKNLYWLLKSLEGYFATQFLKQAISSMDQHFDSIIPDGNPEGNNTNELIDLERTKERFKNFYNNCQEFFGQSIRIFGVVCPWIRSKTDQ